MSHYRRAREAGACYFFTLVRHQRRPVLTEAPLRAALRLSLIHISTRITLFKP
nr:hypothetical protein [Pseudomonas sp. HS-2]